MQRAIENALSELLLRAHVDSADPDGISACLARHGVSEADRAAILEGELEGILLYRELVRDTLREAVRCSIPRTMARLGPIFDEYFGEFLAATGPRTHYLRDVPYELLRFCEPRFATDPRIPAYIVDLARHESLQIEVGAEAVRAPRTEPCGLDLERPVRFIEAVRLVRYAYRVHELRDDEHDRTEPVSGIVHLFVYRNPEHEVRYLELTPMAAAILARLVGGRTLARAMTESAAEQGVELTPGILEATAQLLSDLAERGALLGAGSAEDSASAVTSS